MVKGKEIILDFLRKNRQEICIYDISKHVFYTDKEGNKRAYDYSTIYNYIKELIRENKVESRMKIIGTRLKRIVKVVE